MTDTQVVNQLKFKILSLQEKLADKQKALEQYQTIQSEADAKIKALSKMHADKVKNLLNSIQVLKKQKASIQGLSKEHKRSKLIEQLNKQIGDQDLAIEVLRKWIYDKQGKQKGRQICDEAIVAALTKGPDRIRPLSRQELKMEIQRLKSITINLEAKMKNGNTGIKGNKGGIKGKNDQQLSQISSVSQQSFVNQNDEIFKKLRQLQFENENMKLQVNAKLKIIQKLKTDLKQTDKLRTDLQIFKNEIEIANKKVNTYQKLMKESKQNTNTKIVQLYERQIKVQELEMMSKQNRDKLKQAQQTNNILLQQARLEKQQLQAEIDNLTKQNEQMILQNVGQKKRLEELKKIVKDMDDLHGKQKEDMKSKVTAFESQLQSIVADNKKFQQAYRNAQASLYSQRAQWVNQKNRLLQQLKNLQQIKENNQLTNKNLQQLQKLKKQNSELTQILKNGGGGNDKALLDRLKAQQQKIEFLEKKNSLSEGERYNQLYKMYNELLKKYEDLLLENQSFKRKFGIKDKKGGRKQLIQLTQKEKSQYEIMSSGISRLQLEDVDSDLLDNFDSSLQYEFVINEHGQKVKMPKLTDADKQLLKLMTSDLWVFVNDDKMEKKLQRAIEFASQDEDYPPIDYKQIRQLRNLSNPKGKKLVMYEQQVGKLNDVSDSVSVTSALDKQLNKFDSDVNIEIKKLPRGAFSRQINPYKVQDASLSIDEGSSLSSAKLGESNIVKKKKKVQEKGSRIQLKKMVDSDFEHSSIGSALLDSNVSSDGIRQSQLAMINSDLDADFKRKK